MFLIEERIDRPGEFVVAEERGVWARHPRVAACRVVYDVARYDDALFAKHSIPFPSALHRAVASRRAAFLAGRVGCRRLLAHLGVDGEVVAAYPNREPVWPASVHGSITHCGHEALVVMCAASLGYVGVDLERLDPTALGGAAAMVAPGEAGLSDLAVLINFSAKEALFKALYPRVQTYFGFECAKIAIRGMDPQGKSGQSGQSGQFTATLTGDLAPGLGLEAGHTVLGDWVFDGRLVTTAVLDPGLTTVPHLPMQHLPMQGSGQR